MGRPLEPGLIRIFRYFATVAMIYFAILWGYGAVAPQPGETLRVQSLLNLVTNASLFLYLSFPWLEKRLKKWYLPYALVSYTAVTVFSNLIYLFDPSTDLSIIIARSWALIPILLVLLVITAWQYSFFWVMVFVVFTNLIELFILTRVVRVINLETLPVLGMPLIRAFAFGVVGYIIVKLMETQRSQKRKLIMANIRLGQQANTLEHLATSRERNRLARELHDTLAHTLSGVAVNLEAIKSILPGRQDKISTMLDHSLTATRQGLNETRRALQDLRAQPLEDLGLALALRNMARTFADREGIEVEIEITDRPLTLPPDVEQSFYRIAQEALENIAGHALASRARLKLATNGNRFELEISDDGKGFDLQKLAAFPGRYGITGMQERAAIIGGKLTVESQSDGGTTVRLDWERLDDKSFDL
ncbi:MAG: sensor histidine kinase [Chloroflexi bacterium]|jgi:signal transduction histidine kinase|nr:sensor histidine kinase [Chloroflexota bacterium]